jgi:hypothetical protein
MVDCWAPRWTGQTERTSFLTLGGPCGAQPPATAHAVRCPMRVWLWSALICVAAADGAARPGSLQRCAACVIAPPCSAGGGSDRTVAHFSGGSVSRPADPCGAALCSRSFPAPWRWRLSQLRRAAEWLLAWSSFMAEPIQQGLVAVARAGRCLTSW